MAGHRPLPGMWAAGRIYAALQGRDCSRGTIPLVYSKSGPAAGAIRRAILLGRVSKALFAEKAWEGLDSAETFLGSFLSENVYRERRRMQ